VSDDMTERPESPMPGAFSRAFKKIVGVAPARWRGNGQGDVTRTGDGTPIGT